MAGWDTLVDPSPLLAAMSARSLLEKFLVSGTQALGQSQRSGDLGKYATGAAVGGALAASVAAASAARR